MSRGAVRAVAGVAEVLAWRVVVRGGLAVGSLDGVAKLVAGLARCSACRGGACVGSVGQVESLARRWLPARGLLGAACLERSFVVHGMLLRRGVSGAVLRIGVLTRAGRVQAHAWNCVDSRPLLGDTEHESVRPIWAWPSG
ncbi:MAG: lasso peptide biosynthesis B2 protein [Deltaproteobacteria bacterium]|nr:MAG: lasso peptide biosynthesis B2 protein [Deltaproteobacteria bacterium]